LRCQYWSPGLKENILVEKAILKRRQARRLNYI
jgi:hypothetical protein